TRRRRARRHRSLELCGVETVEPLGIRDARALAVDEGGAGSIVPDELDVGDLTAGLRRRDRDLALDVGLLGLVGIAAVRIPALRLERDREALRAGSRREAQHDDLTELTRGVSGRYGEGLLALRALAACLRVQLRCDPDRR